MVAPPEVSPRPYPINGLQPHERTGARGTQRQETISRVGAMTQHFEGHL